MQQYSTSHVPHHSSDLFVEERVGSTLNSLSCTFIWAEPTISGEISPTPQRCSQAIKRDIVVLEMYHEIAESPLHFTNTNLLVHCLCTTRCHVNEFVYGYVYLPFFINCRAHTNSRYQATSLMVWPGNKASPNSDSVVIIGLAALGNINNLAYFFSIRKRQWKWFPDRR